MNVVFTGSGSFAIPPWQALVRLLKQNSNWQLSGVITQSDKPAGRKKTLTPSPFKQHLLETGWLSDQNASKLRWNNHNVSLFTPEKLRREAKHILEKAQPDLIIVVDYGQIVPSSLLDQPKYGCLNLHHSLLPQFRGATPVQSAILHGLKETGTTIQVMAPELDAGDIISQTKVSIDPNDNFQTLGQKLSNQSAQLLLSTLPAWVAGDIQPTKQNDEQATFCSIADFSKEQARLNWSQSSAELDRHIRAFAPRPAAWTEFNEQRLQIHQARLVAQPNEDIAAPNQPGVLFQHNDQLFATTGEGIIQVMKLQPAGKKCQTASDFLHGWREQRGQMV